MSPVGGAQNNLTATWDKALLSIKRGNLGIILKMHLVERFSSVVLLIMVYPFVTAMSTLTKSYGNYQSYQ